MNSQVSVAGATGFVGSHICVHLPRQGYHVAGLDDLSDGFHNQTPGGADNPHPSSLPKLAKWFPGMARLANVLKTGWQLWHGHSLANRHCFRPVKKD